MRLKDPLEEIVERYLFNASTESLQIEKVVECIVSDYVRVLYVQGVSIPHSVKNLFICDVREEVKELIIKRTNSSINVDMSGHRSAELYRKIT